MYVKIIFYNIHNVWLTVLQALLYTHVTIKYKIKFQKYKIKL